MYAVPMIEAKAVTKHINTQDGELTILRNVSLTVMGGKSVAITGASGSGKSTLLGIMAGLDIPTTGQVALNGNILTDLNEEGRAKVRSENVGFIFQSFQLLSGLTALENVMLPMELRGSRSARTLATDFLGQVGLAKRLNHYPQQLSGGEQQRVAIARAFASQPRVLFADEPTGNLDPVTGAHIIKLLFEMNRAQNATLILITHDERLASQCEQQIEIAAGEIISSLGGA